MSQYIPKEGSGSLWANDKKSDKGPDMRGKAMIGGVLHEVAGWNKESASGKKYLSLNVKPKQAQETKPAPKPASDSVADMDNDIPF